MHRRFRMLRSNRAQALDADQGAEPPSYATGPDVAPERLGSRIAACLGELGCGPQDDLIAAPGLSPNQGIDSKVLSDLKLRLIETHQFRRVRSNPADGMECSSIYFLDVDPINRKIIRTAVDWTLHTRSKLVYLVSSKHPH